MSANNPTNVRSLVGAWQLHDWKSATRQYIKRLSDSGGSRGESMLKKLLSPRIAFGTAGLRAEMAPGFAMLNHVTVRQATLGLTDYLVELLGDDARRRGVVVGHDHRALVHGEFDGVEGFESRAFAQLVAATLEGPGFKVLWLGMCHTPLVAFAVRDLGAAAGIMITASHNPKTYNGLKVYWHSGCQINKPHDDGISAAIQRNLQPPDHDHVVETPAELFNVHRLHDHNDYTQETIDERYYSAIKHLIKGPPGRAPERFVFTALHGVGTDPLMNALEIIFGSSDCAVQVREQMSADPDFPTVQFPNPEEEGALDMAMRNAEESSCRTILAVDPDADRFATAERLPNGDWHRFTGNQVGILLAAFVLERLPLDSLEHSHRAKIAMLASTVSTGMVKAVAEREGFYYEETLTGFKWMSSRAQELEKQGYNVQFAFEEALGYMFPQVVYDKDGISTLAMFLTARSSWADDNLTPYQKLHKLYQKYGYFADANTYAVSPSPDITDKVFASVRNSQKALGAGTAEKPAVLTGMICKSYRDLTTGIDTTTSDGKAVLPTDPATHMITCELDDSRFTIRGSGTEPKIKLYVESRGESMHDAQKRADALQKAIMDDWLAPLHSLPVA